MKQLGTFATSVAFRTERAKQGINQQLSSIQSIKNPEISMGSEMACWAVLALNLQDELVFESIQQLHKEGHVALPKTQDVSLITNSNNLGWHYWPEVFGEGILEYILVPYLVEIQQTK